MKIADSFFSLMCDLVWRLEMEVGRVWAPLTIQICSVGKNVYFPNELEVLKQQRCTNNNKIMQE